MPNSFSNLDSTEKKNYLIYPEEQKNWYRIQAETPRHRSDAVDSRLVIDVVEAHNLHNARSHGEET
jgi:hypothetical protein